MRATHVRAALISLGRQLGQLLITRHKYVRESGKMTDFLMLEELLGIAGIFTETFQYGESRICLEIPRNIS